MKLSRSQLIEQLMYLPQEFLEIRVHREPLLFAIYASVQLFNFNGLLKEFGSSPIASFLKDAIKIKACRKEETKLRIQKEQNDKKTKDRINAQKNIWGAIKRNDLLAINALRLKGIDLDQADTSGISLRVKLKELGFVEVKTNTNI